MKTRRFTKNDYGFICQNCGFDVLPLRKTSRNHCPRCLYSLHVDFLPGDRACLCGGLMKPVFAAPDPKKGYVITHQCIKCSFRGKNKAALQSARDRLPDEQYDNAELLILLTARGVKPL